MVVRIANLSATPQLGDFSFKHYLYFCSNKPGMMLMISPLTGFVLCRWGYYLGGCDPGRNVYMKERFRLFVGLIVVAPIALIFPVFSMFLGKERAVEIIGPVVTAYAKLLQRFFPPKIAHASQFDLFKQKLKGKQRIWRLLYDYPIEFTDKNTVKLCVENCPFAEALYKLKIPEFGGYMCQGDWEIAKDNDDKWCFERNYTIGTGGPVCDFTYKRVENNRL